jgi:hypothetical protein
MVDGGEAVGRKPPSRRKRKGNTGTAIVLLDPAVDGGRVIDAEFESTDHPSGGHRTGDLGTREMVEAHVVTYWEQQANLVGKTLAKVLIKELRRLL